MEKCGFEGTNFINCFASTYMFLEDIAIGNSDYDCKQLGADRVGGMR
jgi:hypothetical protein